MTQTNIPIPKTQRLAIALAVMFMAVLALMAGRATAQTQTFNSTGTFTVPAGVTSVNVQVWGGGGAGGGNTSTSDGGGGGGGGAYSATNGIAVTAGASLTVTVGAGGSGGTGNGPDGGDSWFINNTTILAKGGTGGDAPVSGAGGVAGAGGAAGSGIGTTKFSGGNGGTGRDNSTGQGGPGGSSAGTGANGTSGAAVWSTTTAGSPPTGGGAGGNGGGSGSHGSDASAPGGGGGGAGDRIITNRSGGDGAAGRVVISWTCPTYSLTSTSVASPLCATNTATVTLNGNAANLPTGTYTVTYNQSAPNSATGVTKTMTVTTAGTGSFNTNALANAGATTITITNLTSGATGGTCSSTISTNNTAVVTVNGNPTADAGTTLSTCSNAGAVNITTGSSSTNNSGVQWTSSGTGTWTNDNSLTLAEYTPSGADITAGSVTLTLTAFGNSPCGNATDTKTLTINPAPAVTPATICQGSSGSLTATAACPNGSATASGNNTNTFQLTNTSPVHNITLPVSGVPAGATITDVNVSVTIAHNYQSDVVLSLIAPGGGTTVSLTGASGAGNSNNLGNTTGTITETSTGAVVTYTFDQAASTQAWGGNNPATAGSFRPASGGGSMNTFNGLTTINGNWTLTADDDANNDNGLITAVTVTIQYSYPGEIAWYTVPTGGTVVQNGSPFNPVADAEVIAEGGIYANLVNSNTPGTYTFYAACSSTPTCREAVTFVIDPAATVGAGADQNMCTTAGTATMSGSFGGGASSATWSTAGDGSFDNTSLMNAVYTPGANDITNGSVVLTLTTNDPAGPCNAVADNMTLNIETAPTVNAGTDQNICGNGTATMAGTMGGGASTVAWSTSGDGSFDNANNLTAVYTPGANDITNGTVTLTLTTTSAVYCTNVNDAMVLTIDAAPTANAGSDIEICTPNNAFLNGAFGGAATSASWSTAGDGSFDNASLMNAVYTPGTNDIANGSVVLTLTTDDPAGVCTAASDNLTLTVRSTLPVQPAVITGAPSSVCPPLNGVVLNTASDPNATSYLWATGPGTTGITFNPASTTNSQTIDIGSTVNSTYGIRVSAVNACGTSLHRTVSIRRSVSTPAAITGNTVACGNGTYAYSINPVVGAESYTWTAPALSQINGGGNTLTSANTSVNVQLDNSFVSGAISVSANVACFTSPAKNLSISSSTPALSVISGSAIGCPGGTLTYTVPAVNGAANYIWTLPNNVTGSSSTNSINATFNTGFTSSNICVRANSVCGVQSAPRCKAVAPGVPAQPASISGNTNGLCGQNTSFTTPPVSGVSYTWAPPAGYSNLMGQGTNSISVTMPSSFTNANLCVTATNACGNSTPRCITVKGAPLTPAAITASPASWCAPTEAISFNSNTSALTGVYNLSWSWVPANAATYVLGQGTNGLVVDWDLPGAATVYLTASNACGNTTRTLALNVASCRLAGNGENAQELISSERITVYPNPATSVINIDYDLNNAGTTTAYLIDLSGKTVIQNVMNAAQGFSKNQIDISRLSKGMYLLKINTPDGNVQSRIVIE
ncbi:MAG TPA: T9SS type A sorting domain-containing protein [Bacteroidia bacterium]|nr:T9SS type A sorting domain-containing protein [Bacteroidia bacterium]HNU33417.1 T9SS type A sorting domain-containing protein [Bacteroidia bacterium]